MRAAAPTTLRTEPRHHAAARATLFLLLWFAASFYFFGNLGKWMDDWTFHARNVATGEVVWSKLLALDPMKCGFWRPLHIRAAIAIQTAFWRHDWATHLILAIIHGINAWLLWKVLGRLCTSKQAPAIGALLFLIYPAGHEAIYWNSTIGTTVGVWWLLACILAVQRFAAGEITHRALLLRAPLLLTLGWWYEQAAACAPILAAAYLACTPCTIPIRKRITSAALMVAASLLGGMIYVILVVGTMSPAARGGSQSLIHANEFLPQFRLILSQAWDHLSLSEFARGATAQGWRTIRSRPVESLALGIALVAAFFAFGSWWMRAEQSPEGCRGLPSAPRASEKPRATHASRLWSLAIGAGIIAASMVPAIAVRDQWFAARLAYTPALGLLIILAILADTLLARNWAQRAAVPGRTIRAISLASLVVASFLGATMLIGVQSVWHTRVALDRRIAAALREAVPVPPHDAVFVPVQVRARAAATGSRYFDAVANGPLEFHWSAPAFLRYVYHRSDVHALAYRPWIVPSRWFTGVVGAADDGVLLEPNFLSDSDLAQRPPGSGARFVPWDHLIPIRILKSAQVLPVESIRIEDDTDPTSDRSILLPGATQPTDATSVWTAILAAAPHPAPSSTDWRLEGPDGRTPTARNAPTSHTDSNRTFAAFSMHPTVGAIPDRSQLRATLPPSDSPRTLAMRIALFDDTRGLTDGVSVSIEMPGVQQTPLATELVSHERLRRERTWIVLRTQIPPSDQPQPCTVIVRAGPAGDTNADWCLITPPILAPPGPQTNRR